MGNTFLLGWQDFHGYAVEKHHDYWGAVAVGQSAASGRSVCDVCLPCFRYQSQNCLQVAAPFYRGRTAGFGRSFSSSATSASANAPEMGATDHPSTQASSSLGAQEDPGWFAASLRAGARHGHHRPLATAAAVGEPTPTAAAQSLLGQNAIAHPRAGAKPGMDRGLQGVVSHRQRTTGRTADGTRFVQSLCTGDTPAARSALAASQGRVYAAFCKPWIARGHSDGQWRPLCLDWAGRLVAFELMVDGFGNPRGVYAARPSGRQRGARTDAPSAQTGNHPTGGAYPPRPAASNHGVAQRLQPDASPSGAGTASAQKLVSQESAALAQTQTCFALSGNLDAASGPQQRPDQMARSKTIYWRSIRPTEHWSQAHQTGRASRLFWAALDRTSPRSRYRSHAPSRLSTTPGELDETKSVTHVLSLKCYPCPDTVPSLTPSPKGARESDAP